MKNCKKDYDIFIEKIVKPKIAKLSKEMVDSFNKIQKKELSSLTTCASTLVASDIFEYIKEGFDSNPFEAPPEAIKIKNLLTSIIELMDDFNKLYLPFVASGFFKLELINQEDLTKKEESNN